MMRSLFSGVAGLRTHQTKMDVIGNNIANVNTTAYKSQSITFADLMYQTTQNASSPNPDTGTGGINARQVGLGVKSGAINTSITSSGSNQTTNNPFDCRITGNEFFIVSDGSQNFFTRDGSFFVDAAGNLCMTSMGYNVMGWGVDETTGNVKPDIVQPMRVMSAKNMTYPAEATTKANLSGIIDKNDTDFAKGANGKTVSLGVYDSLGYYYTVKFNMTKDAGDEHLYNLRVDEVLDSNGKKVDGLEATIGGGSVALQYSDSTGKFMGVDGSTTTTTADLTFSGSASLGKITVDFSATTNENNNGTSTVAADNGDYEGLGTGRRVGNMSGISIQQDGKIYATYDNGQSKLLGQIAVASFANAAGLAKAGDNLYSTTQNSGNFDGVGINISTNGDYITTGVLEMSNVDLSQEFTEMITTQRGFQANSRIITVSDTLLEELVNLKR